MINEDGKMQYANWKAKMELGANLEGKYLQNSKFPFSEIGNKLRRQQGEEERRNCEEMKLTKMNFERTNYAVAKGSIEAAEAEEVLRARHFANLKPGEQLSQRQMENIAKHGDTVFQQHYQNMTKSSAIPKKEMPLDIYLPTPVDFKTLPVDLRNFLALKQHHHLLLLL